MTDKAYALVTDGTVVGIFSTRERADVFCATRGIEGGTVSEYALDPSPWQFPDGHQMYTVILDEAGELVSVSVVRPWFTAKPADHYEAEYHRVHDMRFRTWVVAASPKAALAEAERMFAKHLDTQVI